MMGWAQSADPYLPVFADLPSLQRTMHEIGVDPATCGVGGLPPRALLARAQSSGFGVALGVFPEKKGVHYVPIKQATLDGLLEEGPASSS
jgi:hypothetical protein